MDYILNVRIILFLPFVDLDCCKTWLSNKLEIPFFQTFCETVAYIHDCLIFPPSSFSKHVKYAVLSSLLSFTSSIHHTRKRWYLQNSHRVYSQTVTLQACPTFCFHPRFKTFKCSSFFVKFFSCRFKKEIGKYACSTVQYLGWLFVFACLCSPSRSQLAV